jgi:hypothetical protein
MSSWMYSDGEKRQLGLVWRGAEDAKMVVQGHGHVVGVY